MLKNVIVAACLFVFAGGAAALQQSDVLQIPRAKAPPELASYLSAVPTDAGVEISDFKQRKPGDGNPASKPTKAYLSFDDTHFYAIFVAKDDPALIRARIAKREAFDGDDFVTLDLDTFHDKRRSFTFFVNPYGVQLDAKRTDGQDLDVEFDTQWQSDGRLTPDGYVVKMAIPFKSLRFNNTDVQTWGVAVGRVIARLNEESYWPELSQRVAGVVPQFASATIAEKLPAARNLQINPFVYAGKSRLLNSQDTTRPFWQTESKLLGGLDAKWVLGEASALDVTIKPDFSEVESDEPQIVTGKRYEVLFPEKRPFFLENAGFFATPNPLFFSRRISEPTAGMRLTGRADNWAYGGLVIDDQAPGKDPAILQNVGKSAHISMARVQNDLNKNLSLGALFTDRRFAREHNAVFGFDGRYQLDDNWALQVQLANSRTQGFTGANEQGQLRYVDAKYKGKDAEYSAKFLDVTARFDTTLAFLPRTDVRQLQQEGKYLWQVENHPWLQTLGTFVKLDVNRDQQNTLQDWALDAGFISVATRNTWFELYAKKSMEKYAGSEYNKQGWMINTGTSWWDWLDVMAMFGANETINYLPTQNVPSSLGNGRSIDLTLTFKPHQQWRIEEKLLWNDLRTQGAAAGLVAGTSVYSDLLWRTKLVYQHDRFWGLRVIADLHTLKTNAYLSALKPGKQLNTDIQLSYVLSPGTTFYTGFGNRQENLSLIGNPAQLQTSRDLDLNTGRRVFVKLSYLFQP